MTRTTTWLVATAVGLGALVSPLPAWPAYILCWDAGNARSRISCEASCAEGERLVQRSEDEWAGCGVEGPDCGTAWTEWESEMAVGDGATPLLDPCPEGCWRTETVNAEFRTVSEGAELRELWQCKGTAVSAP